MVYCPNSVGNCHYSDIAFFYLVYMLRFYFRNVLSVLFLICNFLNSFCLCILYFRIIKFYIFYNNYIFLGILSCYRYIYIFRNIFIHQCSTFLLALIFLCLFYGVESFISHVCILLFMSIVFIYIVFYMLFI